METTTPGAKGRILRIPQNRSSIKFAWPRGRLATAFPAADTALLQQCVNHKRRALYVLGKQLQGNYCETRRIPATRPPGGIGDLEYRLARTLNRKVGIGIPALLNRNPGKPPFAHLIDVSGAAGTDQAAILQPLAVDLDRTLFDHA